MSFWLFFIFIFSCLVFYFVFFVSLPAFSLKKCASSVHTGDFYIIITFTYIRRKFASNLGISEILQKLQILEITKILQHWSQIMPYSTRERYLNGMAMVQCRHQSKQSEGALAENGRSTEETELLHIKTATLRL